MGPATHTASFVCSFSRNRPGAIDGMFATGDAPAISVINSLRSGAVDSPVLRDLLDADGPKDMLVKFLTADGHTLKELKSTGHWLKDLKDLVARTLGLKLEGPKEEVGHLQEQLWRYLLFSEFAADLPVELPASLVPVPRAGKSHESFVRSLCDTLRDLGKAQPVYEEAATRVCEELGLETICTGIEDFGKLDTFSFEERSFLNRFASQLQAGEFENARTTVLQRRGSFWVERDARRSAEWQLADLAARLMLEIHALAGELAAKRDPRRLDRILHRQALPRWIPFTGPWSRSPPRSPRWPPRSREVLAQARETHRHASDGLGPQVPTGSGCHRLAVHRRAPCRGYLRSLGGASLEGRRARRLFLDRRPALSNWPRVWRRAWRPSTATKLEIACASMPCLTPVGMASLLPGAASRAGNRGAGWQTGGAHAWERPSPAPRNGLDVLAAHVGVNRARLADLEDIANGKLPEDLDSIEVLAVKTTDIDSLGENNPAVFHRHACRASCARSRSQ
jgi:hypothetical protein